MEAAPEPLARIPPWPRYGALKKKRLEELRQTSAAKDENSYVGISWGYIGLSWDILGLYWVIFGLYWRYIGLYWVGF